MPSIFVQIASYRDPELLPTIVNALEQASYPQEITFGVVWQGKAGIDDIPLQWLNHCRVLLLDSDQARGVGWARAKTQTLWEGEPYTLQIDSHMRFVPDWDALLIHLLHQCPSRKPLLTAYPPAYTPPDVLHPGEPTSLGASHFTEQGSLGLVSTRPLGHYLTPQAGMFIAAGFWFAPSQFIHEVPYDPLLYFQGEETNLSIRAWTHGWDIFHPNRIVCYHEYTRTGKPRHWEDHPHWWELNQITHHRLHQLVNPGLGNNLHPYGLGAHRSLSAYEAFSGINFQQRTIAHTARQGIPNHPFPLE